MPPQGVRWEVATQLYPASDRFEFTAPNLQYLMDSPAEFGPLDVRRFTIEDRVFRFAAHHTGTSAEIDGFTADVQKIVAAERAVFGEFPSYEPGTYTYQCILVDPATDQEHTKLGMTGTFEVAAS